MDVVDCGVDHPALCGVDFSALSACFVAGIHNNIEYKVFCYYYPLKGITMTALLNFIVGTAGLVFLMYVLFFGYILIAAW